jgi:hypothetical protein
MDMQNTYQVQDQDTKVLTQLDVKVNILLTRGKHMHDHIISLRGEILAPHKISLIPH